MNGKKLRLGLLLDSHEVPAWVHRAIERTLSLECAELSLVVLNKGLLSRPSGFHGLWKKRQRILYDLLSRVDEKVFHRDPDPFRSVDLKAILPEVPTIAVTPVEKGASDYFHENDVEMIRHFRLDILIRFGFRILRGAILNASRFGVWSYHHGDNSVNRGGPPGFWEVAERMPETGTILQVLTEDLAAGNVLCRSSFFTYPFSPARNRSYYFWTSSSFLPRQIEALYRLGETGFFKKLECSRRDFDFFYQRLATTPTNYVALKSYAKIMVRAVNHHLYQRLFYTDQWFLKFDIKKNGSGSHCLPRFKPMFPPKGRFWADPHVISRDGKYYIFIEEFLCKRNKGHISVIEMDENGSYKDPIPVLDKDYHLSYPFVFEWKGKYYMIPESGQRKTIDLFECIEFPNKWEHRMTLMENVMAVDTTLLYHSGRWWLFTAMAEHEGPFPQVELFLFFSKDLITDQWTSHLLNPIISDVKSARPAGRIFSRNGKLFRPSQDCSKRYGYGIDLNEIQRLSETEYLEEKVASIRPNWEGKIEATHTFASEGPLTIIDAFMKRRKYF